MESGYKILWTDHALKELAEAYEYLEHNFTEEELRKLSIDLDKVLKLLARSPSIFPISEFIGTRRVVIKKYNTLYYRVKNDCIEIVSFFSNRMSPNKRQI